MKKIYFSLLSATALLWSASCNEEFIATVAEGDTEVRFSLELNDGATSRATTIVEGINQLCYEVYAVKRDQNSVETLEKVPGVNLDVVGDFGNNVSLTLVNGQKYKVVFWAQKTGAYVANTDDDLTAIPVIREGKVIEDAFTAVVDVTVSSNAAYSAILTRPFAQINIATNDLTDAVNAGFDLPNSTTTLSVTGVASTYDALNRKATGSTNLTVTAPITQSAITVAGKSYNTLASALVLVHDEDDNADDAQVLSDLSFSITTGMYAPITFDVPGAPIRRNYRTNIVGGLLTHQTPVTVSLDDYEGVNEYPSTPEQQLQMAASLGGTYTLTEDVVLENSILVNSNFVLDLNGQELKSISELYVEGKSSALITVVDGGSLTITDSTGEGKVTACTDDYAIEARGGNIVINGGSYLGSVTAVYAVNGAIEINGGEFKTTETSYGAKYLLNLKDANNATISVKGGKFYGFNPADNEAENPKVNFCADGHISLTKDGYFEVVEGVKVEVNSVSDLNDAIKEIANGGSGDIYAQLNNDFTPTNTIDVKAGVDVHLDLNGKTITVDPETLINNSNGSDYVFIIREGGSLTIDGNGTIEVTTPAPIFFYPAGDLVIENGTFIRNIPEGYNGDVGSMFVGTKPAGGWNSTGVTINGGYFDSGYYPADLKNVNVENLISGIETLVETEADIAKRGQSGDPNIVRKALKSLCSICFNRSNNNFKVYGGTFVGANPAWGDEGCMLPTTPNYLRPWSYYQGAFIDGQTFHEDEIVLPEGYEITQGTHGDGRPTYTVTYNKP